MSQPHSIVGKIAISETSFKKYLASVSPGREDYDDWDMMGEWVKADWLNDIKKDEVKDSKGKTPVIYWADKIDEWATIFPQNLFMISYNKDKKELFFYQIIRFDWWIYLRNDLTILRHMASYADPKKESKILFLDDLFAPSPTLATTTIKAVLTISSGKSRFSRKDTVEQGYLNEINEQITIFLEKAQALEVKEIIKNDLFCYPFIYKAYQKNFTSSITKENLEKVKLATKENPYWFNKGYYTDGEFVYKYVLGKIEGADPFSFVPLKHGYSKDSRHAYNATTMLPGSHGPTFKPLDEIYSSDKNHVYSCMSVMEGVSPDSFKLIGVLTVSNGKARYFSSLFKEAEVDQETFKHHKNSIYYYDKNHVYALFHFDTLRIISDEVEAFEILYVDKVYYYTSQYAKDSQSVFYAGKKLPQADAKTFHMVKNWGLDEAHVWYEGEIIPNCDPKTAKFDYSYPCEFFTDREHAYYCGNALDDLDRETFEVISDSAYAKDKNHFYYMSSIIPDVDRESFEVKSRDEAKDSKGIIYWGERLEDDSN